MNNVDTTFASQLIHESSLEIIFFISLICYCDIKVCEKYCTNVCTYNTLVLIAPSCSVLTPATEAQVPESFFWLIND